MHKSKKIFGAVIGAVAMSLTGSADAATVFITNNSTPKTLASNESDASVGLTTGSSDDGNNNGLDRDRAGASTVLALSADDGGGPITFNTIDVSGGNNLFMDGDSMGHGNDKWGANQNWTFNLDQTISFDAISMFTLNENMQLKSSAWVGAADTTGTGWTFNGTTGTFTLLGSAGPTVTYDFTSADVPDVTAGTDISFGYFASAGGGEQMESFTITVIPEPSSLALLALGGLLIARRRRD